MKYEVVICRQESFTIEAESEEEAEDIAFDNVGLIDFDNREDKRILEHFPEETTKVTTNESK